MRIGLTGATGIAGRFVADDLGAAGLSVVTLGRRPLRDLPHRDWHLGAAAPDLSGLDMLVHAAFAHVPGRYRGGEGDDPGAFLLANLDGTRRLFDAAAAQGVPVIFLSSRAVFDALPAGTDLTEDMAPAPASLYGRVKAEAEAHLAALPVPGWSLRATGLYGAPPLGPGDPAPAWEKWRALFADFLAGRAIAPRRGTEVHGSDLAQAVRIVISRRPAARALHVSDILLDHHDLLARVARLTGSASPLPARSDAPVSVLDCARLRALGWSPGGEAALDAALPVILDRFGMA
ncbi:NAD-dependent epimerase/dehydratase family protein [Roseivivax isoporae]|uniref:UDP-glucose 4-epimerase n=1 Tax=Roseivivax isoporae LMG 25204 TaxID=1449351 RepID=X7F5P2_9RHOB|nr:NAD(P)-dependent oxidoreductase [Roseivivax isoporae]ETX27399.1 UDP-glucose 4-epimerase [Roseivivax isoporae LMG 25204]